MIIRKHVSRDHGVTYSLTELTREDLDSLAFGACTAVAFHATQADRGDSPEYNRKRGLVMNRLERQLRRVLPRHDGVTPDRRVEVVSDSFDAVYAYQEVTR